MQIPEPDQIIPRAIVRFSHIEEGWSAENAIVHEQSRQLLRGHPPAAEKRQKEGNEFNPHGTHQPADPD